MAEQLTDNERKVQKRKDRIKNILIVFLVVMLALTFFSGTIQNWSLPEVATAYVQSGSISPQIRASGTVEADDPYSVTLEETRKVASVAVKEGDEVQKDDILYYLEDVESEELTEAERKLRDQELAFELALFSDTITDATILRATNGQISSISEYRTKLQEVNERLTAATEADKSVQARLDALTLNYQLQLASLGEADTSSQQYSNAEIDAENTVLTTEKTEKENEAISLNNQIVAAYPTVKLDDTSTYPTGDATFDALKKKFDDVQQRLSEITARQNQLSVMRANNDRDSSQLTTQNAQQKAQIEQEYNQAKVALDAEKAQTAATLEQITTERTNLLNAINSELTLYTQLQGVEDARRDVERLREKSTGATINAPVAGTVTKLSYVAGQTIDKGETCAVIQIEGKAMTMSITVTAEQARSLKVGDQADPQNAWAYNSFKATITTIRPDPQDPAGKRVVTLSVDSPEVTAGQTVNIKMGEGQRNYEMTIPNSAIREDNNGKFILIINERSSPLRNRYIAQRVDVDVVASDDTTSAITAPLDGYEYVITTASAPIKSGQEVRLANTGY